MHHCRTEGNIVKWGHITIGSAPIIDNSPNHTQTERQKRQTKGGREIGRVRERERDREGEGKVQRVLVCTKVMFFFVLIGTLINP